MLSHPFSRDLRYVGAYRAWQEAVLRIRAWRAMDIFFWSLLAQAVRLPEVELNRWIDSATHLIYHAIFADRVSSA
jgi:hypothetical protein